MEELLEEDESDITDINNLIYDAVTIMTQTMNRPSKRSKNKKKIIFWENKNAETEKETEKIGINNC